MKHTLDDTEQLVLNVKSDDRPVPRRNYEARFPFLKYPRLKDEFHADVFYPSVRSVQNHACAQIFAGKDTGH